MPTAPPASHGTFRSIGTGALGVYRYDAAPFAAFYAPGCLCVVSQPGAEEFESALTIGQGRPWVAELRRCAELAQAQAACWHGAPFQPVCLTLYLNNECNLSCEYCHTDPSPRPVGRLETDAIGAAGRLVSANCRQKGRPFYVVFHGGGEPTLYRDRVENALGLLEATAAEQDVQPFRYVATNGVMSERKATWLAGRFDLIGLSCDGPADVQNRQRPRWNGQGTSLIVERTAHIFHEEGRSFHARTTITRASLLRQAEIAEYLCRELAPDEIHFEPVYLGGRTSATAGLSVEQARDFVDHFLEARRVARAYGIPLSFSGSRPGALHGPYCHVFRDVLNLVPGGVATACFKLTKARDAVDRGAAIGSLSHGTGAFEIDGRRVAELRDRLDAPLADCKDCFNLYHCARQCPDWCPLDSCADRSELAASGFRCHVQKAIASAILHETAQRLWSELVAGGLQGPHGTAIP